MVYLLKMVIFHSYVAVYQRVKLNATQEFMKVECHRNPLTLEPC